jgi:hypothetical protein
VTARARITLVTGANRGIGLLARLLIQPKSAV